MLQTIEREMDLEAIPEDLDALAEGIVTLSEHISRQTHRLLLMIAEYDRRQGWIRTGHASCAHWLAHRTHVDLGTAREKVRAARALMGLPEISESMSKGELSLCQVRALTRVATPENEGELLEKARGSTVAQVERMVRVHRAQDGDDEEAERRRWESRRFAVFPSWDGMYEVRGRLPAEVGALLMKAIEAASDALYRVENPGPLATDEARQKAAAQRRADAIRLIAERAMAAGFGPAATGSPSGVSEEEEAEVADEVSEAAEEQAAVADRASESSDDQAEVGGGSAGDRAICGASAERYQVMIHVNVDGLAHLDDGTRVSHEAFRRLACDAALVPVVNGEGGEILNVGRRTRSIPPALRRALEVRDRGCRFPGCGSRFADAHHVVHWTDGGETSLANCILLCHHHHRLVHDLGWRVRWGDGREAVFEPPHR